MHSTTSFLFLTKEMNHIWEVLDKCCNAVVMVWFPYASYQSKTISYFSFFRFSIRVGITNDVEVSKAKRWQCFLCFVWYFLDVWFASKTNGSFPKPYIWVALHFGIVSINIEYYSLPRHNWNELYHVSEVIKMKYTFTINHQNNNTKS